MGFSEAEMLSCSQTELENVVFPFTAAHLRISEKEACCDTVKSLISEDFLQISENIRDLAGSLTYSLDKMNMELNLISDLCSTNLNILTLSL